MLTKDGIEVGWPYCDRAGTTLTAKELHALIDKNTDAAARLVAHAHLTRPQVDFLYATTTSTARWGHTRRRIGKRIVSTGTEEFCRGIGERKLTAIFSHAETWQDKRALREALLAAS